MANEFDIRVDETVHYRAGQVIEVEYVYTETRAANEEKKYHVSMKQDNYEKFARTLNKPTLPFEQFVKVLRPFMMGIDASEDILPAFQILDTDHSGTIDIGELAAFMPVIVPDANPHVLLHQVQKVDKNGDLKLNLTEFTDLLRRGIGRDIALGRL